MNEREDVFRHVLLMQWTKGATEQQRQAVRNGLSALPEQIPEIKAWHLGDDLGLFPDENLDFVIIADFEDEEAYLRHRHHPIHLALIDTTIKPILARIERVQYRFSQGDDLQRSIS